MIRSLTPNTYHLIPIVNVVRNRPEAKRACPDQDEAEVKLCGGPNRLVVQNLRMN